MSNKSVFENEFHGRLIVGEEFKEVTPLDMVELWSVIDGFVPPKAMEFLTEKLKDWYGAL